MNELRITASILRIIEIAAWLAVAATLPIAGYMFDAWPRNLAMIGTLGYFLSSLAYVALIRTGRAIVVIAQTTLQGAAGAEQSNAKPSAPTSRTKAGTKIKTYKGVDILWSESGVTAAGQSFDGVLAAERHIDRL
jgi:hypothetical protein